MAAPGAFVNLHGLSYRSQVVVFYVHKLWDLAAPEHQGRVLFIGAERSPQYLAKRLPAPGNVFPTTVPKTKTLVWAPKRMRFSWLAPEEAWASQGMRVQDFLGEGATFGDLLAEGITYGPSP